MKLKEKTIHELKMIMKEEFGKELKRKELEKFAHSMIGYFDLLLKIDSRSEVRK